MSSLSPRERVCLALDHHETDRIPISMLCSGVNAPARRQLDAWLGQHRGTTVRDYFRPLVDTRSVGPRYTGPALEAGFDYWGVHRSAVSYGTGDYQEIDHYPLADARSPADLDAHRWPSPHWFDFDSFPDRLRAARAERDYCLIASPGNIFESSWYMRGFEQFFTDLIVAPELAHAILGRVCDFYVDYATGLLTAADGAVDLYFTADDIGGQQGLLMSLPMWEQHLKPYHARLNERIHELGARVIYHSDGAVMEAILGLLDMGIDVLQALQFDAAGMDPARMKELYGDRLCFEGGVSVQNTLPFGTPDDVRAEVEERIRILGRGGGYILGPSHAIQAGTPPENIVALFDTAATCPMPSRAREEAR